MFAGAKQRVQEGIMKWKTGGDENAPKPMVFNEEKKMYYNKELKCWVREGEEEAKKKELEDLIKPPPPPAPGPGPGPSKPAEEDKPAEPRSVLDDMIAPPQRRPKPKPTVKPGDRALLLQGFHLGDRFSPASGLVGSVTLLSMIGGAPQILRKNHIHMSST